MHRLGISLLVLAAMAPVALGCGGSDGDTSSSITKAQLIKEGDALCQQVEEKRGKAITAFYDKEEAASTQELGIKGQEKLVVEVALPPVKKMAGELEALGAPEGDEAEVEEIIDSLTTAVSEVESNPSSVLQSSQSPFQKPKKLAADYGFKVCLQAY